MVRPGNWAVGVVMGLRDGALRDKVGKTGIESDTDGIFSVGSVNEGIDPDGMFSVGSVIDTDGFRVKGGANEPDPVWLLLVLKVALEG